MSHREKNGSGMQKKKANIRFKHLARSALMNKNWLSELLEHQGEKVPLFRPKVTGILTNSEKTLLRKNRDFRSESERLILVKLMANLIVFSHIPPKLRARLAPFAYFIIIGSKRKLIQQGNEPATVYFVLTGDIAVTTKVWSPVKQKYTERLEYVSGPGEWLGEIDLLEQQNRQHTYTSKTEVELLALDREDFENILLPFLKDTWEEKKVALSYFGYFSFFSNEQLIAACQMATLQQFEPYETIYHEDKGLETFVHFVISGTCMILQCLKMKVSMKRGKQFFQLVDVAKAEDLFKKLTATEIRSYMRAKSLYSRATFSLGENNITSEDNIHVDKQLTQKKIVDIKTIEMECGIRNESEKSALESSKAGSKSTIKTIEVEEEYEEHDKTEKEEGTSSYERDDSSKQILEEQSVLNFSSPKVENNATDKNKKNQLEFKIENHFIDVGSISKGGIFGLGETMEHRIIMAETTVQCLVLPRYWLLERDQNPANMWQRHRIQLDITLPSREILFKHFLSSRKWQMFKKIMVSHFKSPGAKLQDVPIMGRIISFDE